VFEVQDKGDRKHLTHKARTLVKRGVRRVFCIDVRHPAEPTVAEWDRRQGAWSTLAMDGTLTDPCFLVPVPVRALVDRLLAERTLALGLLAKGNPVLLQALTEARTQGVTQGRALGVAEGLGLLAQVCARRLGRDLTDDERAVLAQRLAEHGPRAVGDAVLDRSPEDLARWLLRA
jgi:hypothetical protein